MGVGGGEREAEPPAPPERFSWARSRRGAPPSAALPSLAQLPLPRPRSGPPAQRSRPPPAGGGAGSLRRSRGRRQPAAAGWPPGRGKAGIWRPPPASCPLAPERGRGSSEKAGISAQ